MPPPLPHRLQLALRFAILAALATPSLPAAETNVSQRLSQPAYTDLGKDQKLAPLLPPGPNPSRREWETRRGSLIQRWQDLLGNPSFGDYDKTPVVLHLFEAPDFKGTLLRQPTGPGAAQRLLLMEPITTTPSPRSGAVVPYYHPDLMAGFDLATHTPITNRLTVQFGRHLVERGYVVVCTEAFPYNTVPEPADNSGLAWWGVAASKLLKDHPGWTGMGKLVHDTRRAVDLLLDQPGIDPGRIVAIGHSLGGKMAFYTGCLDPRIKATIASDFGIGWDFTNWKDPWYLGDKILGDGFPLAHHELLALHAPRSFLLIAGQYDKPESWQYLREAGRIYRLHGRPLALGMFDHATGHQPTVESMDLAYKWLEEQFQQP